MNKSVFLIVIMVSLFVFSACKSSQDPSTWSTEKLDEWFNKKEWLNGWAVNPDPSINKKELALYYFKNKERWNKAFTFLKDSDLPALEAKRYDIDGDNLFALVSEYVTKNEEDTKFEAHRKYIDIQYVISGSEQMSVSPFTQLKEVLVPYDDAKDIEFMSVNETTSYEATPDKLFIFFPSDIHRPSVKIGENKPVKKVVIKLRID
jgi:YhcH/YjgK/YiaL family protein